MPSNAKVRRGKKKGGGLVFERAQQKKMMMKRKESQEKTEGRETGCGWEGRGGKRGHQKTVVRGGETHLLHLNLYKRGGTYLMKKTTFSLWAYAVNVS